MQHILKVIKNVQQSHSGKCNFTEKLQKPNLRVWLLLNMKRVHHFCLTNVCLLSIMGPATIICLDLFALFLPWRSFICPKAEHHLVFHPRDQSLAKERDSLRYPLVSSDETVLQCSVKLRNKLDPPETNVNICQFRQLCGHKVSLVRIVYWTKVQTNTCL